MSDSQSLSESIGRYAMVVRRQWWVVALVTVLATAAAVAYVALARPVYSASMKIVVGQGQTLFAPALSVNVQPYTQTITELLESQVVAEKTISQIGLKTTPNALLNNLSVSAPPDTSVLTVTYQDPSRTRAVHVLSTVGHIFTRMVNNVLAAKAASSSSSGQVATQPVTVAVFDPAHSNPGRVSPKTKTTIGLAVALGFIAGLLLAFLRDAMSSLIRNDDEAEARYGAPVIGWIPRGALGLAPSQLETLPLKLRSQIGESFQMLTARLRYSTGLKQGVIVVIGARPEDGKSTLVAHLGHLLAAAGNDVVLVEADLHRPALHYFTGMEPGLPGLREAVLEGRPVRELLIQISAGKEAIADEPAEATALIAEAREGGRGQRRRRPVAMPSNGQRDGGRLRLLPAGVASGNPLNILSLGNASELVSSLRDMCDFVVIDTPPLLLSGDAYPLVQLADAVVVVCREKATSQDEARRTRDVLASLGVSDFSVVLSESSSAARAGEYYGYSNGA